MTQSQITNAYTSLWLHFSGACNGASAIANANPRSGYIAKTTGSQRVQVDSLIYLKQWPYKAASAAKNVDILIKSTEVFSCREQCMTESKVKVMYLHNKSDSAIPILAVHYDFDVPPPKAHPVFHAQIGTTKFEQTEIEKVGFRKKIEHPQCPHYGNLRIPTAYMNLASVLLGIVADHLPGESFDKFLSDLRQNEGIFWNASCAHLRASLNGGGFLHSHHWYNRLPPVNPTR